MFSASPPQPPVFADSHIADAVAVAVRGAVSGPGAFRGAPFCDEKRAWFRFPRKNQIVLWHNFLFVPRFGGLPTVSTALSKLGMLRLVLW